MLLASQFEVRAVVLCYREELSAAGRCAITSPSFLPYFIFPFLSNQMKDVSTRGLSVPAIHNSSLFEDCVGWREKAL